MRRMLVMMFANGDVGRNLLLLFIVDGGVDGLALGRQPLVEMRQQRRHGWALVAQAVDELQQERVGQPPLIKFGGHDLRGLARLAASPEQPVGEVVCAAAIVATVDDAFGDPPEILDQDDPQRNGRRPELANRQRLDLLIGVHEARPDIDVEPAVGVGDEGPGHAEDARIAGERAIREFGKLAIVARRKVRPDLADLPLDLVESCRSATRRAGVIAAPSLTAPQIDW
jgi:hypothetical protein